MSDRVRRGFQMVGEEPVPDGTYQPQVAQPQAQPDAGTRAAMRFWLMSMQNISARMITGLSHLFTAAVVASAWALFMWTLPTPTTPQLVGLGLYGLFCLAVEWIRRARP
jgi:hypothetical protein